MNKIQDDADDIELTEHKPLRDESTASPIPATELALVQWASGAFVVTVVATAAMLMIFCHNQSISISKASADEFELVYKRYAALGGQNASSAKKCMLALAASGYDPQCYVEMKTVNEVNRLLRNRWIHFMGESFSRDAFHGLKSLQFGSQPSPRKVGDHSDQTYRSGSSLTSFKWAPFLSDIVSIDLPKNRGVFTHPDYVYIAVGLHDILYRIDGIEPDTSKFVNKLQSLTREVRLVMLEVPPVLDRSRLAPPKSGVAHFDNERISAWIHSLSESIQNQQLNVFVLSRFQAEPYQDQDDGIHSMTRILYSTDRLLQIIHWFEFPAKTLPYSKAFFCFTITGLAALGMVIWFQVRATFFAACSKDVIAAYRLSATRAQSLAAKVAFMTCPSAYVKFVQSCAIVFLVMVAVYLADGRDPVVSVAHKSKNGIAFALLYIVTLLVAALYRRRLPANIPSDKAVLNRLQTEEWKGMMQVAFIWYHFFDTASTYNLIRVFVTSYVWMTGYGNFTFFQCKRDFSLHRIMKTLFRLNFLVLLLCVTLDREWMLYYICPLHTMHFLFIWVFARVSPSPGSNKFVFLQAAVNIGFLVVLFSVPELFENVFSKFGGLFLRNGSLWEWRFRAQLDAFSSAVGILCACFLPAAFARLEKLDGRKQIQAVALSVCGITVWLVLCLPMEKSLYNRIHPYIGFIPMLGYLVLRNQFPRVRTTYMPLFQFIGTITLETYLLQLHLYMSHDAKMIITYLPENPVVNFALSTSIYLLASYLMFKATICINDFLFPSKPWSEILLRRLFPILAVASAGTMLESSFQLGLQRLVFH